MSNQNTFSLLNSRRKAFNTFWLPGFEFRLPIMIVALTVAFAGLAAVLGHTTYDTIVVMEAAPNGDSGFYARLIEDQVRSALVALGMVLSLYTVFVVGLWGWHTRRVMGPEVAFRRQVEALKNGDYTARVLLRDGDAFEDLANDLNELAAILGSNEKPDERQDASAPE
ncbi:MAG: hypothetical protein GY937_09910 [bacterium]|nr:hypothetical protein [bacterium]